MSFFHFSTLHMGLLNHYLDVECRYTIRWPRVCKILRGTSFPCVGWYLWFRFTTINHRPIRQQRCAHIRLRPIHICIYTYNVSCMVSPYFHSVIMLNCGLHIYTHSMCVTRARSLCRCIIVYITRQVKPNRVGLFRRQFIQFEYYSMVPWTIGNCSITHFISMKEYLSCWELHITWKNVKIKIKIIPRRTI